ncbi:MAG: bifunctional riboflavin kinase/FAD synthetase [Chlorobi bacterium]|nr:bifunctional riboflavin kinase/FAD synthetase [Chlorobiota bacterium]
MSGIVQSIPGSVRTAVTAGSFDGIHRGHRYLIDLTRDAALRHRLKSLIITFDPHPALVLRPQEAPPLLTVRPEKEFLLKRTGADYIYFQKFDKDFARLTAEAYLHYLYERFGMRLLVLGYDHRFGSDRLGDYEKIKEIGRRKGFEVIRAKAYRYKGKMVSSSLIRQYISNAKIRRANELLGYDYMLWGQVVHGSRFGRKIGFPTANLRPLSPHKLIPPPGVYDVRTEIEGKMRKAVMNIGMRPTLDGKHRQIEVHIPGFSGDLYGKCLHVNMIDFLRPEKKFASVEELKNQILRDIRTVMDRT